MKRRIIVAVLVSWAVGAVSVRAAVFCEKKSGAVVVRDACKKKETALDLANFGALGPKGDPGTPGTPGSPGAPGAAVAYAHVLANGSVDSANAKNVTSANVTLDSSGIVPVFCFHDLSFSFHNLWRPPRGTASARATRWRRLRSVIRPTTVASRTFRPWS